jgi:cell shape-determining protein MreD
MNIEGYLPPPHVFVLFLVFSPLRLFRATYFISCFSFGILLDALVRPLGAHAFAAVFIGAMRGIWIELVKPNVSNEELQVLEIETQRFSWQMLFLIPMIFLYELCYYILADFALTLQTIIKVVSGTVYTALFCVIFTILFYRKTGK